MKIVTASFLYNPGSLPIEGGGVAIRDGRVVAVGTRSELLSQFTAPLEEHPGCILMPGMVNAHTHLELTHFPAWKIRKGLDYSPRTYTDWIIQVIKLRRGLTSEEVQHSLSEGIRISLEAGTTTVGDILTDFSLLPLYGQFPLDGRIYLEMIGHDPFRCAGRIQEFEQALTTFDSDRLLPGISPHAPHTLSDEFMRHVLELSRDRGIPGMVHLAESPEEVDFCFDSSGHIAEILYPFIGWEAYLPSPHRLSPVAWVDSISPLTPLTTVVHSVHVTPADVGTLRDRGVSVVLCPRSNERLAVGMPPLMLLKGARIPLAIGTDSLASNDSLSVWDEIRFIFEKWPQLFSADDLLVMATSGGAKALHLQGQAGLLEPGRRANIQVMKTAGPLTPNRVPRALVESGEPVSVYLAGSLRGE
jgi:cytosine/adenosine deaminase-related metal-dependent hydrolase